MDTGAIMSEAARKRFRSLAYSMAAVRISLVVTAPAEIAVDALAVTVWLRARRAEGATGATLFGNKLV